MSEPEVFEIGDVVKVLSETRAKDFEGNIIELQQGVQGTVIEVAESEFQLEVECLVENDIVVVMVYDDQVELVWRPGIVSDGQGNNSPREGHGEAANVGRENQGHWRPANEHGAT